MATRHTRQNNFIGQHWGLDDDGNSILHVAAATGRLDLLEYFYLDKTHRSDINAQNFMGWTPLMQAARFGHFNCIQFLCQHVDIFKRNKYGLTAISLACAHGDLKSVQLLFKCMINFGLCLNEIENPISPLTFSVLFGHFELVQFFISKSFNIYHKSVRTGVTPIDCTGIIRNQQIMSLLQNIERKRSPRDNNFKSSTLKNNLGRIPDISITNFSRNSSSRGSCANIRQSSNISKGSLSSLSSPEVSPISPVFLDDTFTVKHLRSNENLKLGTHGHNRTKQIFFPPDFEIPKRNGDRLSPALLNRTKRNPSLSPMEVVCRSTSPQNMYKKTMITQTRCLTTRNSTGDITERVTNTYTVERTNKSHSYRNNGCNKMVNTNLQFDSNATSSNTMHTFGPLSPIILHDLRKYKYPNESFYKLLKILQTNELGRLIPLFVHEEIDYEIFLTLTLDDIIVIGITSIEDQQKIIHIINQLLTKS